uniref:CBS domain-containing protein CBSX5-like n=1 Tax=Nelumbo nucifera TaxID=4432 RepID=A0A822Z3D4_NELNU|nr:TPA_asm: hypothetical protein HUJ06_008137 [Nelumbo nucifera]
MEGAQNLVVPIQGRINSRKKLLQKSSFGPTLHNGREFYWLTQEDVIRFLLSSINIFSPIPAQSIDSLGIIGTEVLAIRYHNPTYSAADLISNSLSQQTSIAVIDDDGNLIREIFPYTLASCDKTIVAAITTLSIGDLMAYINYNSLPEALVQVVKARLKERKLEGMLELLEEFSPSSSSSCSSGKESSSSSPRAPLQSSSYNR